MNKFNDFLLLLLSMQIILFSKNCFAGRYDISHGGPGWIVYKNLITLGIVWYFARQRIKETIERQESLNELYNDWLSILFVIVIISVVLAWFNLPSDYYIYILRPILFIAAVIAIFKILSSDVTSKKLLWLMAFFALMHNPIFPVVLGSDAKYIWVILNIIFVVSLLLSLDSSDESFEDDNSDNVQEDDANLKQERLENNFFENAQCNNDSHEDSEFNVNKTRDGPDTNLMIYRHQIALVKSNIHFIIPILEEVEQKKFVPAEDINKLINYVGGSILWRDRSSIDKGCVVTINNIERVFDNYSSLKSWINVVLTKRLLEYVSNAKNN